MKRARSLWLASLLASVAMQLPAATLNAALISSTMSDDSCNPGPAKTKFLTTDSEAWAYVSIHNAIAGDQLIVRWMRPDSAVYHTTTFSPLPSAGNWCFDSGILIAGNSAAQYPGTWTVVGIFNGQQIFSLTFTLETVGGGNTGDNLISNPGAEASTGTDACQVAPIPSWVSDGYVAVCRYSDTEIPVTAPGPPDRGSNFFSGGPGNAASSLSQTINVNTFAALIDPGNYGYTLSGWLGGWDGQDDHAQVWVTFSGASGSTLGTTQIGPVLSAERQDATGLVFKSSTGLVPSGTRYILVEVKFTRTEGSYNDGAADNLSLTLGTGGGGTVSGLVGWWKLDEISGPTAMDSSGYGNNGAWVGGIVPAAGKIGGAYSFNGINSFLEGVSVGTNFPTGNTARAISAWIKAPTASFPDRNIFHYGTDSPTPAGSDFHLFLSSAGKASIGNGHIGDFVESSVRVDDNQWHHVVGTYEGSATNRVHIYVDGVDRGVRTLTTTPATGSGSKWTIGRFMGSGTPFQGLIDDVRLYSGGLSAAEIQALFVQGGGGGGGTVSGVYYRFENGTAGSTASGTGTILDSGTSAQHGTPSGSLTYSADVPAATIPLNSAANHLALTFGASGKVQYSGTFPLNTLTNATIELWIKPTGSGEMDFLWTRTDSSDANRFNMGVLGSGTNRSVFLDYRTPSGTQHIVAPGIPVTANAWTHIAVVKSGNVWTSYANGVQQGQPVTDANPGLPTNTGWTFNGRSLNSFSGLIDEFRISDAALTPAQFLQPPGGGGSCNYLVSPLTNTIGAAGGTGLVLVTTAPTCTWSATSNTSWIAIQAGTAGTGSGAVSYNVSPNTVPSIRTGTLTIAGQTHAVTQAAGAACTYGLSSTSTNVAAAGATGAVLLTVNGSGCSWTATSDVSWIAITAGASGTVSTTVNYRVDPNAATEARTGTLTIAGLTYTVSQAGQPAGNSPVISQGGVVNAASYAPASLASGAIARGSFFSIFGTKLGPVQFRSQTTYPLPTILSETSVTIRKGGAQVLAYMVFTSETQINAIMPSNAPLGDVEVIVTYRNVASPPVSAKVAASNFGIFSTAAGRGPGIIQNFVSATSVPLNTRTASAKPGQVEILLGTGLGAINAPDNDTPPVGDLAVTVEVTVGGRLAQVLYKGRMPGVAGVDQINFLLPNDVPTGCYVPVQIKVGGNFSNSVTMSIHPTGAPCEDPFNPFSSLGTNGGTFGAILLIRANVLAELEAGQPPLDLLVDLGIARFQEYPAGGDLGFNPLFSLPPVGSCSANTGSVDLGALLGGDVNGATPGASGILGRELDAGMTLTVTGPRGSVPLVHLDTEANTGPYVGMLGGTIPLEGAEGLPPFLEPGAYQVTGAGGADIGPFTATLNLGPQVVWTNRDQITRLNRSSGVTLTWSGGDASKIVIIGGVSTDQETEATAGFFCFVPAAPGTFTVPASVLANMPATGAETAGAIIVGSLPTGNVPSFTASGMQTGVIVNAVLHAKTVPVE